MIVTRTPYRMSFFGGGSDLPEYFHHEKGSVLSTTFDRYVYVTVDDLPPYFPYTFDLKYARVEQVCRAQDIQEPLIRYAFEALDVHQLRLTIDIDLPSCSGLGSSSSLAVGMMNALHHQAPHLPSSPGPLHLAKQAIYLERELIQEAGGWQDQVSVSFGGMNRIDFYQGEITVTPIHITEERKRQLNDRLMLFYTGISRRSNQVHIENNVGHKKNHTVLKEMVKMVDQAVEILESPTADLDAFGRLLGESWNLKKRTGKAISNDHIDHLYHLGLHAGALGGKLLGAGSGGFLLFYVPLDQQDKVRLALKDLTYVPFAFEEQGSMVLFNSNRVIEEIPSPRVQISGTDLLNDTARPPHVHPVNYAAASLENAD